MRYYHNPLGESQRLFNKKKQQYNLMKKLNKTPDSFGNSDVDTDGFEIDVQPKRKYFDTIQEKRQYIEEYTKKKKTELCKNYALVGFCRYGDECSFAHGDTELLPKGHLHQKYKTKPCKRFFKQGYCPYGIRCQYIHDELKDIQSKEFERYLHDVFKQQSLTVPIALSKLNSHDRLDIQRFFITTKNLKLDPELVIKEGQKRLSFFQSLTDDKSFLSENSSRKSSDSSKRIRLNRKLFV
ncbi:hypothetical protein pb186bvf_018046 [Paramecium bursaria]